MLHLRHALLVIIVFGHLWATLPVNGHQILQNVSIECQQTLYALGKQHQETHGPVNPDNMLYFLHIPRTAGRTYGVCLLKQAWAPSRRCAKSYDILRLNTSVPDCGLLSSHDDYSVLQYLPTDAAIATQLRDPVDRVLSMYEFAIEVAARHLHPNATQKDPGKMDTRKVWPWSILGTFMQKQLEDRVSLVTSQWDCISQLCCSKSLLSPEQSIALQAAFEQAARAEGRQHGVIVLARWGLGFRV